VTRDDVLAAWKEGPPPQRCRTSDAPALTRSGRTRPARIDGAREEVVKLSTMRRSIAEHMVRSLARHRTPGRSGSDVTSLGLSRIRERGLSGAAMACR